MSSPHSEAIEQLIGGRAARAYLPLVDRLIQRTLAAEYLFVDVVDYASLPDIYWREMLYRAHWAAAVSLRRSKAWLDGAATETLSKNPLAVSACLRGFIESAADTSDALGQVPLTIATMSGHIKRALAGQQDTPVLNKELEDKLIHFSYARKVSRKSLPEKYRAKSAAEYLAEFTWFNAPQVTELYSQLCEYSHAAAPSVHMFVEQIESETSTAIVHRTEPVSTLPEDLSSVLEPVTILGFTTPLLTLAVLNYFPVPTLHTPEASVKVCSAIPMWPKIDRALREGATSA